MSGSGRRPGAPCVAMAPTIVRAPRRLPLANLAFRGIPESRAGHLCAGGAEAHGRRALGAKDRRPRRSVLPLTATHQARLRQAGGRLPPRRTPAIPRRNRPCRPALGGLRALRKRRAATVGCLPDAGDHLRRRRGRLDPPRNRRRGGRRRMGRDPRAPAFRVVSFDDPRRGRRAGRTFRRGSPWGVFGWSRSRDASRCPALVRRMQFRECWSRGGRAEDHGGSGRRVRIPLRMTRVALIGPVPARSRPRRNSPDRRAAGRGVARSRCGCRGSTRSAAWCCAGHDHLRG